MKFHTLTLLETAVNLNQIKSPILAAEGRDYDSTAAPNSSFAAVMRWQGPDPAVEIETRHPGFPTPETAALFANGFSPNTPMGLRLGRGHTIELLLQDDRYVRWQSADVTVWLLKGGSSDDDLIIADDADFEPKRFADFVPPPTALGDYMQAQYAVLDHHGEPVDLVVDWDGKERVRITVHQAASEEELRAIFQLGAFPGA